jgi:hypothetical protein
MVTVSAESAAEAFPRDGTDYGAVSLFGAGSDLGGENYVVSNGTADRVVVTGLTPCKRYRVRVFEYNQNDDSGNHALYLLGHHPEAFAIPQPSDSLRCSDIKPGSDRKAIDLSMGGVVLVALREAVLVGSE